MPELPGLGDELGVGAVDAVPSTRLVTAGASALASASLCTCVTHWQVYPLWQHDLPLLALAASLAVGLAYARLVERAGQINVRLVRARRPDHVRGTRDRTLRLGSAGTAAVAVRDRDRHHEAALVHHRAVGTGDSTA